MQRQPDPFTGEWQSSIYKYEVQINQVDSKTIQGVTYSYKQKQFYGKAAFKGLFTKATKNILLKETKMLELKTTENSSPCLMTCYLDYSKSGNVEKLTGTFSSIEDSDHKDCGGGTITLQRVLKSDFKKEDFLVKKPVTKPAIPANKSNPVVKNPTLPQNNISQNKTQIQNKPSATIVSSGKSSETIATTIVPQEPKKIITDVPVPNIIAAKPVEVPEILKSRANKFMTKIIVNVKDITVDYYDNGEIDGDVISVYDNNKRVINHDTLSTKPLRLNIHSDENNAIHELITVAENLGSIPPNTCLMIVNAGRQRIEVPMSSDEKTNAKVVIEYKPLEGTKITTSN